MRKVYVDIDPTDPDRNCTGCRMCEVICAFAHEKVCNPAKSRIRIVSKEPLIDVPVLCKQCKKPPCVDNCPVKALAIAENGTIVVDEKKCIGCERCAETCPFNAISMHPDRGKPIICDLCNGNPKCVEYCPTKILKYSNAGASSIKREKSAVKYGAPQLKAWGLEKASK